MLLATPSPPSHTLTVPKYSLVLQRMAQGVAVYNTVACKPFRCGHCVRAGGTGDWPL